MGSTEETPIEPLSRAAARITRNSFKDEALKRMSILPVESDLKAGRSIPPRWPVLISTKLFCSNPAMTSL